MIRIARLSVDAVVAGMLAASAGVVSAQPSQGQGAPQQPNVPALLHLRPDQMSAFQAAQAASRLQPAEISTYKAASPQALASLSTPARLDRISAALNTENQVFQRRAAAIRAFYGQLSPDQQKAYDQLTAGAPHGGSPG